MISDILCESFQTCTGTTRARPAGRVRCIAIWDEQLEKNGRKYNQDGCQDDSEDLYVKAIQPSSDEI